MERLQFSSNGRHFQTADGKPFIWVADTAWTLPARLKWDDVQRYMSIRKAQGFTVLQLQSPSIYGMWMNPASGEVSDIFCPEIDSEAPHKLRIENKGQYGDDTVLILSDNRANLGIKVGQYGEDETVEEAQKVFEW